MWFLDFVLAVGVCGGSTSGLSSGKVPLLLTLTESSPSILSYMTVGPFA
jgi:hypothetical protein